METIDLSPFCDPGRERLSKPWSINGKTYATDGRIAIVLDSEIAEPPEADDSGKMPPNIESVMGEINLVEEWFDFPEIPVCENCGNKYEWEDVCTYCDGTGESECSRCGQDCECEDCEGEGKTIYYCDCNKVNPVEISNRRVAKRVAGKAASLPGAKWGVSNSDSEECVFFRFDGGQGALMPLRKNRYD